MMGVQMRGLQRQWRGRGGRMVVLVRLAWLCWRRRVVSWRRFPWSPWRHSFTARVVVPFVDRAPQDRVAEHDDGQLQTLGRLLHGRRCGRRCTGRARTRRRRRGNCSSSRSSSSKLDARWCASRGESVGLRQRWQWDGDGDGGRWAERWRAMGTRADGWWRASVWITQADLVGQLCLVRQRQAVSWSSGARRDAEPR